LAKRELNEPVWIGTPNIPAEVEVILQEGEKQSFLCILNHPVESVSIALKDFFGTGLLTGQFVDNQLTLEAYGMRMIAL
jgi:hypothetical protein